MDMHKNFITTQAEADAAHAADGRRDFKTHPHASSIDAEVALAALVARRIVEIYPYAAGELFIADHRHEELPAGSASVSWEGSGELAWTVNILDEDRFWALREELGIWFEPQNGVIMAIHKDEPRARTAED